MRKKWKFLGVITFLVPVLIMTYYAVIGGWILRYIVDLSYKVQVKQAVADDCFTAFISFTIVGVVWIDLYAADRH